MEITDILASLRPGRGLRAAGVLAAALVIGQLAPTAALADHDADVKACFSSDDGKVTERVVACTRVIESGKMSQRDLAGAYNWRGEAYRILKQYELALNDYARSIEINPNSVYPFANRAEVYRLQEKYDLVIADTTQAIRIDPMLNASYAIRGMAYEKKGDVAHARADFNKALSLPVKGNDGPWAQNIARNHLQSLGGGDTGGGGGGGSDTGGGSARVPGNSGGGGNGGGGDNSGIMNPRGPR
jgi:tetratricopeptide (TPR) repeat protein